MVTKSTDKSIEEAIELGKHNQEKSRYLNWCKHLHIDLLSASPVGQAVRLPIGPHKIYCNYYSGGESVNVELVAAHFIEEHCVDCPYHEEIHKENVGRAIVDRIRERRTKLNSTLLRRRYVHTPVRLRLQEPGFLM